VHRHVFERRSPRRDKVLLAHDRAELDALLTMMLELDLEMQVTEIVGGGDERIVVHTAYLDERGEPLMEFTHRKLRQRPVHFGVGCYVRGEWLPEVAATGLRFARAAGVRGMAVTEFKEDPVDGTLKLIECNARFNLATALVHASGFDVALLSYRRTLGAPLPALGPARFGRHLWHPGPDVRSFLDYRRNGELTTSAWLRSLLHRQTFSLFALSDPMPSIVEQTAATARAARLARRRITRRRVF
jgi:D-aspartate ligase